MESGFDKTKGNMEKPRRRKPKSTDKAEIEKAFQILKKAMQSHPEIEATLWAGAMMSCLVDGYINSHVPYEYFCLELEDMKRHYKQWFEEHD